MYIICSKRTVGALLCAAVILTAALLAGGGIWSNSAIQTSGTANWGLSFQSEGGAPVGNASAQQLKKWDAYYLGDTSKKRLYLTFDAGYENGYTEHILDVLKKHEVKAAFFLVGNYISTKPELVKRMVSEGHIVGNHTFNHPDMSKISSEESFHSELIQLENLFEQTTGQKMQKFYCPPQGKYSEENLKLAQQEGYKTIFWSLAYVDWYNDKQPTRQEAMEKLMPRIHNGAVILLHSTSKTNSEILDDLLTNLEQQGYTFGEITELVV